MKFYNTLTKQKEEFLPLEKGKVSMYTCGPTVYDFAHIGNLRSYVFADTLRRLLEFSGYEVRHIKNITDVGHMTADDVAQGDGGEDKMIRKAALEHKTPEEIALFYEERFHEDEDRLNILRAQYFPRATQHVSHMIKMIEGLIASGHAYAVNGNVFFDVTSFETYGALSGNTLEKLKVGARLEEHPDKKNPWDFALWLKAPQGHLMHWSSPWSEGYPGWHIECSAMSQEYLGNTFDIHTGGEDNIFPHHEAEIAQSESCTGKPFVRYWLHARHILVNGTKMSKSKGNFYRLADVLEQGYSSMDLRMAYLSAHYRSQMNFTWESLDQARKAKDSLFSVFERLDHATFDEQSDFTGQFFLEKFIDAFEDDLNTPLALAVALEFVGVLNSRLNEGGALHASVRKNMSTIFALFGIVPEKVDIPQEVIDLAEEREIARKAKDFTESDRLRFHIKTLGFQIKDTPEGYQLKKML